MTAVSRISLRRILARQFMLAAALPLLLFIAFWSLVTLPRAVATLERENTQTAGMLRAQIEAELRVPQRWLQSDAALIAEMAPDGPPPGQLLRHALEAEPAFEDLCLADAQGIVREAVARDSAGVRASDLVGLDLSQRPFYAQAHRQPDTVWSSTFLSPLTGQVTAVLAQPAGTRLLVAEMSLGGLSRELARQARPSGAAVLVLDGMGRVIVHPHQELASWQENLAHVPLIAAALRGEVATGEIELDGERWFASIARVQPAGWFVLVAQRRALLYAPLAQIGIAGVLAALLALGLAALIALRQAGREAGRYRHLVAAAQAMVDDPSHDAELELGTEETHELWLRLREVLDRLQDQEQIASSARRHLQSVLDAATEVAVIETDATGQVLLFNRGAEKMLLYPAAEVIGAMSALRWHDAGELAARSTELTQRLGRQVTGFDILSSVPREAGYEVRDWTLVRRDGSRLLVSLACTAMRDAAGQPTGFLEIALDQTQRQRAAELESARERAEFASQAKSEFLSRVSHELRTPLNAMLGYAQLLRLEEDRPLSPVQAEQVRLIETAGWHLVRLIDDVLDLSRIEEGQMTLGIEPVALREALVDAVRLVAPQALARGVMIQLPPAGGPPCSVMADATRLRQVFVNLLSNAVKYNVDRGRVELALSVHDDDVVVQVSDTGSGLDEQQLGRLFAPFDRLGLEGSGIEGTGIGLVITKRLLELMHGRIAIESRPGEGTRVTVHLPRADTGRGSAVASRVEPLESDPEVGGDVVYVEDNEVNALLMGAVFGLRPACGLQVCRTLEDARQTIARQRPQLVLVDLHLPDGSGLALLEWLRTDPVLASIPAVVLSADATREQRDAALRAGARDYLTKPIQVGETLRVIDELLRVAHSANPGETSD